MEAKALVFMHGRCFDLGFCRPWSLLVPGSTPDNDDEEGAGNPGLRLCDSACLCDVGIVQYAVGGTGRSVGSVEFAAGDADNPGGSTTSAVGRAGCIVLIAGHFAIDTYCGAIDAGDVGQGVWL